MEKNQKAQKPILFENTTLTQPKQGIMPVFGPGMIVNFGVKKKKKSYLEKTQTYHATLNSEETKSQIMALFNISEEVYFTKIEAFNQKYPEAAYIKNKNDILSMLMNFFAQKEP